MLWISNAIQEKATYTTICGTVNTSNSTSASASDGDSTRSVFYHAYCLDPIRAERRVCVK